MSFTIGGSSSSGSSVAIKDVNARHWKEISTIFKRESFIPNPKKWGQKRFHQANLMSMVLKFDEILESIAEEIGKVKTASQESPSGTVEPLAKRRKIADTPQNVDEKPWKTTKDWYSDQQKEIFFQNGIEWLEYYFSIRKELPAKNIFTDFQVNEKFGALTKTLVSTFSRMTGSLNSEQNNGGGQLGPNLCLVPASTGRKIDKILSLFQLKFEELWYPKSEGPPKEAIDLSGLQFPTFMDEIDNLVAISNNFRRKSKTNQEESRESTTATGQDAMHKEGNTLLIGNSDRSALDVLEDGSNDSSKFAPVTLVSLLRRLLTAKYRTFRTFTESVENGWESISLGLNSKHCGSSAGEGNAAVVAFNEKNVRNLPQSEREWKKVLLEWRDKLQKGMSIDRETRLMYRSKNNPTVGQQGVFPKENLRLEHDFIGTSSKAVAVHASGEANGIATGKKAGAVDANGDDAEMISSTTVVAKAREVSEIVPKEEPDLEEIYFADEASTAIEEMDSVSMVPLPEGFQGQIRVDDKKTRPFSSAENTDSSILTPSITDEIVVKFIIPKRITNTSWKTEFQVDCLGSNTLRQVCVHILNLVLRYTRSGLNLEMPRPYPMCLINNNTIYVDPDSAGTLDGEIEKYRAMKLEREKNLKTGKTNFSEGNNAISVTDVKPSEKSVLKQKKKALSNELSDLIYKWWENSIWELDDDEKTDPNASSRDKKDKAQPTIVPMHNIQLKDLPLYAGSCTRLLLPIPGSAPRVLLIENITSLKPGHYHAGLSSKFPFTTVKPRRSMKRCEACLCDTATVVLRNHKYVVTEKAYSYFCDHCVFLFNCDAETKEEKPEFTGGKCLRFGFTQDVF